MLNENVLRGLLRQRISTQVGSDNETDIPETWDIRRWVAPENWLIVLAFTAVSLITVIGWIILAREVENGKSGLGTHFPSVVMLLIGMGLNLLIFYLLSLIARQRNAAVHLAETMSLQFQNQIKEIELREQRLELATRGADVGLWDRNFEDGCVYFSPRWKALLGYGENEFANTWEEWLRRVHPDDVALVSRNEQMPTDGQSARFQNEYRARHKDGSYIWVQDRGLIIVEAQGRVVRMVGLMTDITEQKRVEKLKGEFISSVSHELRTPLTSISASLSLLEAGVFGELPSKALGLVNIASKNSKRLAVLVNDILDLEKLHSGKTVFRADELDLVDLVNQSLALNFEFARSVGVNVTLSHPSRYGNVIGDKDKLLQIMANLMSNATKFSNHGGEIEVRITQQEKFARVEIEDHGIGIAKEFHSRMFVEFAQADISDARRHGGTGLGLNIAKKLVERMGGEIGYESEFGRGSTFWFTVPTSTAWNIN